MLQFLSQINWMNRSYGFILGLRDKNRRSHTTFIDVEIHNPKNILYEHDKPVLSPGNLGCFDEGGLIPFSIVRYDDKKYLYYIGWNLSIPVVFTNHYLLKRIFV